jgi:glycosyltransferase involved in cell wall biosynthesis
LNVLVLSNMKPSKAKPINGNFVQNQVDELANIAQVDKVDFLGICSTDKSLKGLLTKYFGLLLQVFFSAVFSRTRYDVVHVHYYFPTIWYALVYKLFRNPRTKIVVTYHGGDVYGFSNPGWLYRFAERFVDQHIFVSEGLEQAYFKHIEAKPRASAVISAGILNCFEPQKLPTSEKIYDLLIVGQLIHRKGIDRLLDLMELLEGKLHVGVIGGGPELSLVESYCSDTHQLTYLGMCDPHQLVIYFHQSKFMISAAREEAFGLVISEAMASGTPVLATTTAGGITQVHDEQNGYLLKNPEQDFATANVQKVQSGLDSFGSDQYATMAANAVKSVRQYKLDAIMSEVVSLYCEQLGRE